MAPMSRVIDHTQIENAASALVCCVTRKRARNGSFNGEKTQRAPTFHLFFWQLNFFPFIFCSGTSHPFRALFFNSGALSFANILQFVPTERKYCTRAAAGGPNAIISWTANNALCAFNIQVACVTPAASVIFFIIIFPEKKFNIAHSRPNPYLLRFASKKQRKYYSFFFLHVSRTIAPPSSSFGRNSDSFFYLKCSKFPFFTHTMEFVSLRHSIGCCLLSHLFLTLYIHKEFRRVHSMKYDLFVLSHLSYFGIECSNVSVACWSFNPHHSPFEMNQRSKQDIEIEPHACAQLVAL